MPKAKYLIFTGGGSGGHVMPALTIIKKINEKNEFDIHYIGGINTIERELCLDYKLTYHPIYTGKLRRYFSFENLKDIFKIFYGLIQSFHLLLKFKREDTLVFATGGFVCVPVVIAAKMQGKKVFIHEQTSRVGLANKICSFFADKIFISFEDSFEYFNKNKTFLSGYPVREECYSEIINPVFINGIKLNDVKKPILFVTGGGNGAQLINKLIIKNLNVLTSEYVVVHQVGKNFIEEYQNFKHHQDYFPVGFVGETMIDLYKLATVVVSRAGAGTVCELLAIGKKSILIPLKMAQKNEQFFNALAANKELGSIIILEKDLSDDSFLISLKKIGPHPAVKKLNIQYGLNYLIKEIRDRYFWQ